MTKRFTILLLTLCAFILSASAQYERMTDLPTVYIETFDGNGIYSKDVYEYCRLHYVDESGLVTSYDSVSIRGRGNSTWGLSKKPYKLKFLNKEKFLGKGYAKCKKWTLLANAGDKPLMRNAVTSFMGEFTTLKFNPAVKFVDMVLNGTYQGTYQISDQVDVRPHRVDITEQDYPLTIDSDISGGYLLEVDGFKDGNYFTTTRYKAPVRIHYPDEDEITREQTNYIRNHVAQFETVLASTDFADAEKGYRALVDTVSLIDWYICTEVSANIDGFFSTFFYKEQGDDRLFWGPLWDYDIAYDNDQRITGTAYQLMSDVAYSGSKDWVNRMWDDPWFQRTVYHRYVELLDAGLVGYMHNKIDSLQQLLSQSQELNYAKWGIGRKMYHEIVLYSSYEQYVEDLKTFVTDHCAYLKQAFYEKKPLEPTPPFAPERFYYHILNAKTFKPLDIANDLIVQKSIDASREEQEWEIKTVGDYFQLINRGSAQALNDPTQGEVGPTTNVGTQLNVATPDEHDLHQLWRLLPQGTDGYYNLENAYTQHIANLNGGNANDGTPVLSYTNDSRNSTSTNRLWYILPTTPLPEPEPEPDPELAIGSVEPAEYALAYNPQTQALHFGSATPEALTFPVRVYTASGRLVGTFRASDSFIMSARPAGIYIVTWTVSGKTRSVKFRR